MLHRTIAGPDEYDFLSQNIPVLQARRLRSPVSLAGWRIGVCDDWTGNASSKAVIDNYNGRKMCVLLAGTCSCVCCVSCVPFLQCA